MTFSIRKQSKHSLAFLDIFAFFVIRFLFEFASKKKEAIGSCMADRLGLMIIILCLNF